MENVFRKKCFCILTREANFARGGVWTRKSMIVIMCRYYRLAHDDFILLKLQWE